MILTCPECSTRYLAKDGAIGPNGRTVRCAKCETTWFVSADADEMALRDNQQGADITAMDPPPMPAAAGGLSENPFQDVADQDFAADVETAGFAATPSLSAAEQGAHVTIRDKADRKKRNARMRSVAMIWAVPLAMLVTASILAYVFRQDIVNRVPATATLYKSLNIPVTFSGLDFDEVMSDYVTVNGETVLVVNGSLRNVTDKPRQVPMVELSFHDVGGNKLLSWYVETETKQIQPRARVEFISEYPNPPVDAVKLRYKIADEMVVQDGS